MTRHEELAAIEAAIAEGKLTRLPQIERNEAFHRLLAEAMQARAGARGVDRMWRRRTRNAGHQ